MCRGKVLRRFLALWPNGRGSVFHSSRKQPVIMCQHLCSLPWPTSQHRSPLAAVTELWCPRRSRSFLVSEHTLTLLQR